MRAFLISVIALTLAATARAEITPVPTHDTGVQHQPVHAPAGEQDLAAAATQPTAELPALTPATLTDEATFAKQLDLGELRALSLQDRQTVKTWDTFARQAVAAIAGRSTFDDREPLFTLLDIAFRPNAYFDRDILFIKNIPLRLDIASMPGLTPDQAAKIKKPGFVSLAFWSKPETQAYLQKLQQDAVWKSEAIGQTQGGAALLNAIMRDGPALTTMNFLPPPPGAKNGVWLNLPGVHGNVPMIADALRASGKPVERVDGYDDTRLAEVFVAVAGLQDAWASRDAPRAQANINQLVTLLPALSPAAYPSAAKRHVEVLYNKLYKLTLPGAALYFVAFVMFLMAAYSGSHGLRRWAVGFMLLGFALHTCGIAIRWWLDQKSTGSWFYSIPIKNQFESVMMSAWFGLVVGGTLELIKKKSIFGAAASFVGWMSLIALFTVPYVFGKDIGNEIGRVNGILMSYWLYIHVTLATASYALIGMSFLLGVWWLVRYFTAPSDVREMSARRLSADAVDDEVPTSSLAMSFIGAPQLAGVGNAGGAIGSMSAKPLAASQTPTSNVENVRASLARLDACNVVILQLAFWVLAVAIVCGAVWADVSWGRPWGWDAKETFALVTWMVYLVILHVRLVTKNKAYWTAVLCVVGFFIMLFNWIGVNYFLVGLHSYA